ncbi:hypothetical protein EVAR_86797_1 [Eumeta japonica]|uniref:C2H2-type domain-containing protein n=1 Tax=Eumeta variegata TaxID=151549 RepID=A0A4C1VU23_EUMVA|nr:hypothetical protein EVAR_86797_1 [Eumeta japonica]
MEGKCGGQMEKSIQDISNSISQLNLVSFRRPDEIKKLANHFKSVINNPLTQQNAVILNYMRNLEETHKKIYNQPRELTQVEYIFTPDTKSNSQRQRFNSISVSEISELLKTEFPTTERSQQVHICIDCNVEIPINEEEPLMESLQRHFDLEIHQPKLKRESVDVAEPIILPNMSRRLSAMECGDIPVSHLETLMPKSHTEKLDRLFSAKLEASLIRHLPDNSESSIDAAMKFYQSAYDRLCSEVLTIDFSTLTSTVAPIIMSIKDNVNQNFAGDANKNFETDEIEQDRQEKPMKNQIKKYRYYGPIEAMILKLLSDHKLLSLIDDRTGKPAFFCIACEYYTLRFRYDSVLNHVFNETHMHNLACIIQADMHIPFSQDRSVEKIRDINVKFLMNNNITESQNVIYCSLCKINIDNYDSVILHVLDDNHLGRMSDKLYRKTKVTPETPIPDEWGPKSLDWAKFLAGTGKVLCSKDHVVIENFIKPSGKVTNYCTCCDMTLKGPRQVLFNHIRQKKHLRNAAPLKLAMLFKNFCRSSEYYASFGNYYLCSICPGNVTCPCFSSMVEHIESDCHIETIAKLVCSALHPNDLDKNLMKSNGFDIENGTENGFYCQMCNTTFESITDSINHIFTDVIHQNAVVQSKYNTSKGDIISVYMKGNFIMHSEGTVFDCVICSSSFNSLRSLLNHLVYAEHFKCKPSAETIFRFYLELKHNLSLWMRNKYVYKEFGNLKCGVCNDYISQDENAKRHVVSFRHRENMGASFVNMNLDPSALE